MSEHNTHVVPYKSNVLIWIDLLIMTFVTIEIAQFNFHDLTVVIALLVASVKTYLVGYFFMHLKFEKPVFVVMFLVAVAILALVMGLTVVDYLYR